MPIWRNWNPPTLTVTTATYEWMAPYAYNVHELQGNRWTDRALSGSNLPAVFSTNYQISRNLDMAFLTTTNYLYQNFLAEVPVKTGRLRASQIMNFY